MGWLAGVPEKQWVCNLLNHFAIRNVINVEFTDIYNDRKQTLVRERVVEAAQELQFQADEYVLWFSYSDLPARIINFFVADSLGAWISRPHLRLLSAPLDFRQVSCAKRRKYNWKMDYQELQHPLRTYGGLLRTTKQSWMGWDKTSFSLHLAERGMAWQPQSWRQAMDILDSEASEDEAARNEIPLNRLPSHEANVELIEKERRYRRILADAGESDETIRQKWDDWEESIAQLTWNEVSLSLRSMYSYWLDIAQADLEASVPSSTVGSPSNFQSLQTRNHARSLRARLEQLDALHHDRDQLVNQARNLEAADDIQPRVLKVASGFERLTEIRADMFEDILDEELAKYDRFINVMGDLQQREESLLADIKVWSSSRYDWILLKDKFRLSMSNSSNLEEMILQSRIGNMRFNHLILHISSIAKYVAT